ncbi:MAG: BspA family leucine-rich repeat surface protein [Fretibacterium sp.]|nr:BspA family leucine-rich repeat surface protein [Fretibacterium sp.]
MKNFSKNLALLLVLLVALCAPAWAETQEGDFGGYYDEESHEQKDQAHWKLNGGTLIISKGRFNRAEWDNVIAGGSKLDATSIIFRGTKLVLEKGKTETSLESMFSKWYALQTVNLSGLNISKANVTSLMSLFNSKYSLTSVTFGGSFNTSNVKDMTWMFNGCTSLKTLNLSGLNTSGVKDMYQMFQGCSSLETVTFGGYFSTANVKFMSAMFRKCEKLKSLDLSSWDISSVTDMNEMFEYCYELKSLDLSGWNTANVKNMNAMFLGCRSLELLDLSSFNTSGTENMGTMFDQCKKLKTILVGDGWTTDHLSPQTVIFLGCDDLVGEKGTIYDGNNDSMDYAHIDGKGGKPGYLSSKPTLKASGWFGGGFQQSEARWALLEDGSLFISSGTFTGKQWLDYIKTDDGKPMQDAVSISFSGTSLGAEDETGYSLSGMFSGWKKLKTADLSGLDATSSWFGSGNTTASAMFYECRALTTVTFGSNFNKSVLTDMNGMFADCDSLAVLDLSGIDTSNVTDMTMMFYGCKKLRTIIVGDGWSTAKVTDADLMFDGDYALVGGQGTRYSRATTT